MKNLISQVVLLFFFGNTFAQQQVPVKINTQSKSINKTATLPDKIMKKE